jgi:signal transduction histidine kinase
VAPGGSAIDVYVRRVGDEAVIQVVDEGPGIRPQFLDRAFDRFWRAPDAAHQGSGIGLAVVHQLAIASGGRAELRNRADRSGIVATVTLPIARPLPPPRVGRQG